mmetsp:Transcript_10826/g.27335  ORF Transcript_10826/g.27335 Transcript_10826/m.27335 type:complete len:210 (-) Transcript_10826:176-805(-)
MLAACMPPLPFLDLPTFSSTHLARRSMKTLSWTSSSMMSPLNFRWVPSVWNGLRHVGHGTAHGGPFASVRKATHCRMHDAQNKWPHPDTMAVSTKGISVKHTGQFQSLAGAGEGAVKASLLSSAASTSRTASFRERATGHSQVPSSSCSSFALPAEMARSVREVWHCSSSAQGSSSSRRSAMAPSHALPTQPNPVPPEKRVKKNADEDA